MSSRELLKISDRAGAFPRGAWLAATRRRTRRYVDEEQRRQAPRGNAIRGGGTLGQLSRLLPLLLLVTAACAESRGRPVDFDALGYLACVSDEPCLPWGFCNEAGYCQSECRDNADCWGFGSGVVCVGHRCVLAGSLPDAGVTPDGQLEEAGPQACLEPTGRSCHHRSPGACLELDMVPFCADSDCVEQGWDGVCTEAGACVSGCPVDYGDAVPSGDSFVGIWGGLLVVSNRSIGVPFVDHQDLATVHHLLVRIGRREDRLVLHSKICAIQMRAFAEDTLYPPCEPLAGMLIPPAYWERSALIEHQVLEPPPFEVDATFVSTVFHEVRGALLEDPLSDSLPDLASFEAGDPRVWDQDEDGKPGMTSLGCGLFAGAEFYAVQRWSAQFGVTGGEARVVDGDRIGGLVEHHHEQHQVAGTEPALLIDPELQAHADADRSYFRLLRMAQTTSCEDVLAEAAEAGSWLEFTARFEK